jgi:hypothetical protein
MEDLTKALKTKKNWESPGEDNLNYELYEYAEGSFHETYVFF